MKSVSWLAGHWVPVPMLLSGQAEGAGTSAGLQCKGTSGATPPSIQARVTALLRVRAQACCNAASRAKRAIMLSGTPSLSRPYDLYRQVRF